LLLVLPATFIVLMSINMHRSLKDVHEQYKKVVARTNEKFQEFVASNTSHLKEPDERDVSLAMDWESQMNKVNNIAATHEKGMCGSNLGGAAARRLMT
jgi:hypothetical protein